MENQENGSDLAKIDELQVDALSDDELEVIAGGNDASPSIGFGGEGGSTTHSSCSCSCCISGATS
jgi:hypothetical protein